jgi:hypothetical protein
MRALSPQSELQRTRGELSAAHKKLAAAAAERASVAAGRAAAASAAEMRALAAENAAEELKARLGEINRLTSTLVLSQLGVRAQRERRCKLQPVRMDG